MDPAVVPGVIASVIELMLHAVGLPIQICFGGWVFHGAQTGRLALRSP